MDNKRKTNCSSCSWCKGWRAPLWTKVIVDLFSHSFLIFIKFDLCYSLKLWLIYSLLAFWIVKSSSSVWLFKVSHLFITVSKTKKLLKEKVILQSCSLTSFKHFWESELLKWILSAGWLDLLFNIKWEVLKCKAFSGFRGRFIDPPLWNRWFYHHNWVVYCWLYSLHVTGLQMLEKFLKSQKFNPSSEGNRDQKLKAWILC